MATKLDIFNLALSQVGGRADLESVDGPHPEAAKCRLWYDISREVVFERAYIPEVRRWAQLTLLAERDFNKDWVSTDPPPPYSYGYALPDDFLRARTLTTADRNIHPHSFLRWGGENGEFEIHVAEQLGRRWLVTHVKDAVLEYSAREDQPERWDASLVQAVAFSLASRLALPISGSPDLVGVMVEQTEFYINRALENQANADSQLLEDEDVAILRARHHG